MLSKAQEDALTAKLERDRQERLAAKEEAARRKERELFDGETRSDGSPWATEMAPRD